MVPVHLHVIEPFFNGLRPGKNGIPCFNRITCIKITGSYYLLGVFFKV
jgi:hypothetical protein